MNIKAMTREQMATVLNIIAEIVLEEDECDHIDDAEERDLNKYDRIVNVIFPPTIS